MRLRAVRIAPGGRDVDLGTLSVEDGALVSDPPELATMFSEPQSLHDQTVAPKDGDRFLTALLHRYGRGSYLRLETE